MCWLVLYHKGLLFFIFTLRSKFSLLARVIMVCIHKYKVDTEFKVHVLLRNTENF